TFCEPCAPEAPRSRPTAGVHARSRMVLDPSWPAQADPYRRKVVAARADTKRTAPDALATPRARSPPGPPARIAPGYPRIVRAHSYCKCLPDGQESGPYARLYCAQRLAGFPRYFHVGQPFKERHFKSCPLLLWHAAEYSTNPFDCLLAFCGVFQVRIDRDHRLDHFHFRAPLAPLVDGTISGDDSQPRGET